jgi:hypothetical protein
MNCEGCLNRTDCEQETCSCDEKYFHVGQIVTLRGRLFQIKSVKPKELRLKLYRKTTHTVKGAIS